tara:strand:+ start:385 stop:777 length:393 start_codon:yes stop_codon:yes gene_type:complete
MSSSLGLQYRLNHNTCKITLYGAKLGGPIYHIYDRVNGVRLATIVIPPGKVSFEESDNLPLPDADFPTRTFLPEKYVIDGKQYTSIMVQSNGITEEIINECGEAPPDPNNVVFNEEQLAFMKLAGVEPGN